MQYGDFDGVIGSVLQVGRDGVTAEGVKIRIEIREKDMILCVGPRDWQWDRESGQLIGKGCSLLPGETFRAPEAIETT